MTIHLVRRLLLPLAAFYLMCILLLRFSRVHQLQHPLDVPNAQAPLQIPTKHQFINVSDTMSKLNKKINHAELDPHVGDSPSSRERTLSPALGNLTACPRIPNRFTGHIRLPNKLYNISMNPTSVPPGDRRIFWNPTIFALPYWSKNQYIIVNMVAPDGEAYRRNVVCEANICHPKSQRSSIPRERYCTEDDLRALGPNGGLRCVTTPIEVDVPPTPAERCEGMEQLLADIPGFHDPRLFYSGRGEPILMLVSQSRYACIGLWAIDFRVVYPAIEETFSSSPRRLGPGPLMSYPTLTELTRNPPSTRRSYEKNWVMFSPSPGTSYIQYELDSTTRTFAQLIGGGLTTPNLTDFHELPCLNEPTVEELAGGHFMAHSSWHQATPSLRLILCRRSDSICNAENPGTVFFAAIQRKHVNSLNLPLRYERYFVVWAATSPFSMLAVSQHPILFANETNRGWTADEAWDDVPDAQSDKIEGWGKFTYTTTLAWAWGRGESDIREKGTGYLDDDVIFSVGIDDQDGLYGKVQASEVLQCLRICPGQHRVK